jgi:CRP/FNR family transcriptional regulator
LGLTYQTLLRMRADSFLPGSSGDVLRGWRSSAFLVGEKERTAMAMSLKEEIRLLSMVDILGPLSDEELEDLAKRVPDTFLEKDDILYTPKEGTERLFILKEGRVFGEMALTGQSLKGLYVRALTPATVVSLRREDLENLIMKTPEVGLRLVRELAERLHDSEARYADVVGKDVPARLATLILTLVDSEGVVSRESYRIPTHYTHEQLGTMIGCKRVAVTRAFRKLEERGAVELKERRIIVKDMDALKGLAEAG